jgi:hypothetical protein
MSGASQSRIADQLSVLAKRASRSRYEQLAAWAGEHSDLLAAAVVALGFGWRIWVAQATFFNTDEAWHFSVANQNSVLAAYRTSLTIYHPPLLILILYFWKSLGTSNLMLRLPSVIPGAALCWVYYKWLVGIVGRSAAWVGLIFITFLPPMIALSAELRQYTLMMFFSVCSAYLLESALAKNSVGRMAASCLCLYLAMLSHYSAFLFAAALGVYCIVRIFLERPRTGVVATWAAGQAAGIGLAYFLYATNISKLSAYYAGAQPLHRVADWYLSDWYFHAGKDNLFRFLFKGTVGIFRFACGQTTVGQFTALLFFVGVVLLFRRKAASCIPRLRTAAFLLFIPFFLSWIVVIAGLYPYGRTRHCVFLALFGMAGVGVALAKFARDHSGRAAAMALALVLICHIFGTLQGRDMLPLAQQRHEHMDRALQLIHSSVSPADVIFTDKATAYQLGHYLCHQKPVQIELARKGFESFRCDGLRVVATGPNDGALSADTFATRLQDMTRIYSLNPNTDVWVVQGGWSSQLGETLRARFPAFSGLRLYAFDHYLEVFELPSSATRPEQR